MASIRVALCRGIQRVPQQLRQCNLMNKPPKRKFHNGPPRNPEGENPWPYSKQKLHFWTGLGALTATCIWAYQIDLFKPKFGEIDWDKIRAERNAAVDEAAEPEDADEEDEDEEEEAAEEEEVTVEADEEEAIEEEVPAEEEASAVEEAVEEEEVPAEEAVVEEAVAVEEAAAEEPASEEPVAEEPVAVEEPAAEEPAAEEPAAEEPAAEEPAAEEPAAEEPAAEEPAAEEPAAEEPAAEEPVVEEPVGVEEPAAEEPAAEEPAAEEAPAPTEEPVEDSFDIVDAEEVAEAAAATEDVPEIQAPEDPVEEPAQEPVEESAPEPEAAAVPEATSENNDTVIFVPSAGPPSPPEQVQYLLIGAGTASVSAMRAILKADPNAEILMVGAEPHGPYMRPPLSKELWFNEDKTESSQLIFNDWSGNKRSLFYPDKLGDVTELAPGSPALLKGTKVVKLDPTNQKVTLSTGEVIKYGKCLLAPGGEPKTLPSLEPSDKNPCLSTKVHLFRNISQYQQLSSELNENTKVLVIGGGFVGSELAYAMTRTGAAVYQSFPEGGNMGRVLPKYLSNWTTQQLETAGVHVRPETKVVSTECRDNGVLVQLNTGEELTVDHILVAVGLKPSTELGDTAGLEVHGEMGGYVVNAELEARSNLFVAGDAACFYDPVLGRRRVEHHDHAVVSGKLAGQNMAGAAQPYHHQSMFWSDLGPNVGYEAIGLVDSSLPTVGIWAHKDTSESEIRTDPGSNEKYEQGIVFYMDKNKVVGVLTWNIFGKIPIARQVIAAGEEHQDFGLLAKQFDIYTKH